MKPRIILEQAFQSAVNAAKPDQAVRQAVKSISPSLGCTIVLGAGKAAASKQNDFVRIIIFKKLSSFKVISS